MDRGVRVWRCRGPDGGDVVDSSDGGIAVGSGGKGGFVQARVPRCASVATVDDVVIVAEGLPGGGFDAGVGGDARTDDGLDAGGPQQQVEIGAGEAAVAVL